MPKRALCEVLFSRNSAGFKGAPIVYTEDVGGSSPSSPTKEINNLAPFIRSDLQVHLNLDRGKRAFSSQKGT
jgi:hypothetical protein